MPLTTIGTDAIDALAVTTPKLAADSITTAKIAAGAVGTTDIADNAVDGAKIAMTSDAQGDVLFYGGTDYERLGPGTSGQFLKTQGASQDPIWGSVTLTTINTNAANRIVTGSGTADTLNAQTNFTYDGNTLDVKNSGTASSLKLYCESSNAHYQEIKAAPHSGSTDWTLTLPGTNGTSGQFLQTNGSGVSTWALAGATGAGGDQVFYENGQTVTTDFTVTASNNAMSAGPVTVASGINVTLTGTSEWVIV